MTRWQRTARADNPQFDTSALHESRHGELIHRDYAAHFFRWGFARRFIGNETEVLDVGCGTSTPLLRVLAYPPDIRPRRYVGVDFNPAPRKWPKPQWAECKWEFDFTQPHPELGEFDLITSFEVIEHMRREDGEKLLAGMRDRLKPGGKILLSTPNANGRPAVNHIHEWEYDELRRAIDGARLHPVAHYGTFMNVKAAQNCATPAELDTLNRLRNFYSDDVAACFLAPLYPRHARNIIWVLQHSYEQAA